MAKRPWEVRQQEPPGNELLKAALDYAGRGWPVFPCVPNGKAPITENGFKDAVVDEVQIRRWWKGNPNANIGIATGSASGLVVVDVDVRDGKPGMESLLELAPAGWETLQGVSWSGGYHYFFLHPGHPLGCKNGLLPGLDVKGDGGYIIAPPSRIQNETYRWRNDSEIAPLPEAVIHRFRPRQAVESTRSDSPPTSLLAADLNRIRSALGYLDATPYETWVQVGMALYELAGGSEECFRLWDWWSAAAANYDSRQMRSKWASFASDREDKITENTFWHLARDAGWRDAVQAFAPQDLTAQNWPFSTLEDIKRLSLPDRRPIIGPFLSAATTVVAASRGTGKTLWMTEIAQAVASGEKFCQWQVDEPGKVAFVQLDMPIQAVQNRAGRRLWHSDLHYVTRWHFHKAGIAIPNLGDPKQHRIIIEALSGYKMVIFDTRRAAQPPGDGAAANLWHPSYWLLSQPVRHELADAGVALVFLDHLNADGSVKDTKSIEDDVDTVLSLKDSDKGDLDLCFHVELPKDRDHVGGETYFEFDGTDWRQFTDESEHERVYMYRQQHTVKETAEHFGISERTVKNWVRKARVAMRSEAQALANEIKGQKQ